MEVLNAKTITTSKKLIIYWVHNSQTILANELYTYRKYEAQANYPSQNLELKSQQ